MLVDLQELLAPVCNRRAHHPQPERPQPPEHRQEHRQGHAALDEVQAALVGQAAVRAVQP